MKTIVELYDKEPIKNILATSVIKPERVIFLGDHEMNKIKILNFFQHKNVKTKTEFITADTSNVNDIFEKLEAIYKKYPDIAIHVTGGGYLELISAGKLLQKYNIPLFYYEEKSNSFINICNCPTENIPCNISLNIEDFFILSGASLDGHGHLNIEDMDEDLSSDIQGVWRIFYENSYHWKNFVNYIQTLTSKEGTAQAPDSLNEVIYTNKAFVKDMLSELETLGVIKKLEVKGNKISYSYKNLIMKKCIHDSGIILELYIYMIANKMNYFDDIKISTIIDWNGIVNEAYNVQNEVDVILTKGVHPIFISCKSGKPTTKDLIEIHTLVKKFGGEYAKGIIATSCNFSRYATAVYKRAYELDLIVIEKEDIDKNRIEKILKNIAAI